jgi:hypothetical protein
MRARRGFRRARISRPKACEHRPKNVGAELLAGIVQGHRSSEGTTPNVQTTDQAHAKTEPAADCHARRTEKAMKSRADQRRIAARDRRGAAVHEAGHLVVAANFGLHPLSAWITPNESAGRSEVVEGPPAHRARETIEGHPKNFWAQL